MILTLYFYLTISDATAMAWKQLEPTGPHLTSYRLILSYLLRFILALDQEPAASF